MEQHFKMFPANLVGLDVVSQAALHLLQQSQTQRLFQVVVCCDLRSAAFMAKQIGDRGRRYA